MERDSLTKHKLYTVDQIHCFNSYSFFPPLESFIAPSKTNLVYFLLTPSSFCVFVWELPRVLICNVPTMFANPYCALPGLNSRRESILNEWNSIVPPPLPTHEMDCTSRCVPVFHFWITNWLFASHILVLPLWLWLLVWLFLVWYYNNYWYSLLLHSSIWKEW